MERACRPLAESRWYRPGGVASVLALLFVVLSFSSPGAASTGDAPLGLTAIAFDSHVELAWQPVLGASGYTVYRGTSSDAITTPLTAVGGVSGTQYTDASPADGSTYFYAVTAVGGGGESAASAPVQATPLSRSCSTGSEIVVENCYPGSAGWKMAGPAQPPTGIEGFATATSINAGGSVDLKVNTAQGAPYHLEIYRTGYYGGSEARLVSAVPGLSGVAQPYCQREYTTGLVDCSNWTTTTTITTTQDWPSGVYLIRLAREDGADNQILLVVRHDSSNSAVQYSVPVGTYQAYNNYGGRSLYAYNSWGGNTVLGSPEAAKVSFDRPYNETLVGDRNWYTRSDIQNVSWLEQQGYDVSYVTSVDLETGAAQPQAHRVFISPSHDEYWSATMRTALNSARDQGTGLVFLGGNAVYWKVRFEGNPFSGVPDRVEVCYKTIATGVSDPSGIPTTTWRDPAVNQPENALVGEMYVGDNDSRFFPLRVSQTQGLTRLWRYTTLASLAPGTSASVGSNLVGWEWDAPVSNGFQPSGLVVSSGSPVTGELLQDAGSVYGAGSATVAATEYQAPSGAWVFASGTNQWSRGLGYNEVGVGEPNQLIKQAMVNVLQDSGVAPTTPDSGTVLDRQGAAAITQVLPANGATGVSPTAIVVVTFDRQLDPTTVNAQTATLTDASGNAVAASVTFSNANLTATLAPSGPLRAGESYSLTLSSGIQTWAGAPLARTTTTFTTAPLTVTRVEPANGSSGVPATTTASATFSLPLDPSSVDAQTFTLTAQGGSSVPASVTYDATTSKATLTPTQPLSSGTTYTASLSAGIRSAGGTGLTPTSFSFTTAPFIVTQTTPPAGAGNVGSLAAPGAGFSAAVDPSTLTGQTFFLNGPNGAVAAAISYNAATLTATLTPTAPLASQSSYTATLTTGVKGADGTPLQAPVTWSFTTANCPCQLFAAGATPTSQHLSVRDGRPLPGPWSYELGVKIQVTSPVQLTAIRFYKDSLETGSHTGTVWSSTGTVLARTAFTNETVSGWQQQALAAPLTLQPGRVYVVSVGYNAYFGTTTSGLLAQITSGPLQSVADGRNGVYGSSAGTFPTSSYRSSNYYVDAVVQ